jgi:hypothetical protein
MTDVTKFDLTGLGGGGQNQVGVGKLESMFWWLPTW